MPPVQRQQRSEKDSKSVRSFRVFTDGQQIVTLEAPSLRAALRGCGIRPEKILAAVDIACLPAPETESQPFLACFLKNPNFTPPKGLG